ncbi:hypothetical protein [Salmonella enterica]|uniref:hypothetical protein n=1 Tax=Salmonella enterica TaxID=28901 RepID=UPI0008AA5988|nr:hypothetical protein [Salmonella enterica]OHL08158.1 hypothetical protein A7S90_22590 [Salmonella enterica subsp. enterica serovar Inverness]
MSRMESVVQPLKNIQGEVLQKAKGWGCRWGNLPVLARYRIGTYVSVKIEFTLINRIRLRTFLSLDNQGTRHVPAIAY